jgi:hypothetical protein
VFMVSQYIKNFKSLKVNKKKKKNVTCKELRNSLQSGSFFFFKKKGTRDRFIMIFLDHVCPGQIFLSLQCCGVLPLPDQSN